MHVAFFHTFSQGSVNGGRSIVVAWEERIRMPMVVVTARAGAAAGQRKPKGIVATPLKTNAYLHFSPQQ